MITRTADVTWSANVSTLIWTDIAPSFMKPMPTMLAAMNGMNIWGPLNGWLEDAGCNGKGE
jgi:hypothetical protein